VSVLIGIMLEVVDFIFRNPLLLDQLSPTEAFLNSAEDILKAYPIMLLLLSE
jgi:hypothetical protein